ncbi:hypothetical protein EB1_25380 [Empedobacter brevis NBRC 14943 = ATCC 43319]|uniref:Uncharacterized protein n=1 Tax=Empedobacter brevis NBRC 14943 = ATCC 43319 TaxID=1218108 RepID=A0A511NJT4_9FLAO|nr:hypothetical protein EB1_25380 [Empedobacter brevis NBRC 14943 = ATCC 43319]
MIRITEVQAFFFADDHRKVSGIQNPIRFRLEKTEFRIGLEIFLSEGFRSVRKNYWNKVERIFLETQKDFFE